MSGSRAKLSSTYSTSDALGCADFSELEVTGIVAGGFTELLRCFGFTLGLDDLLLTLLSGAFDEEGGTLSLLLCDLFAFDGRGVLLAEAEFSQRNVIEDDVKVGGTFDELATDQK